MVLKTPGIRKQKKGYLQQKKSALWLSFQATSQRGEPVRSQKTP